MNLRTNVRELVITAAMTAVLCILAPLAIPIGPVPISLATFAVMLCSNVLGWKRGVLCVLIYLALGVVGVPVFSGFAGGISCLLGPTGGYLFGYLLLAFSTGFAADRFRGKVVFEALGMIIGTILLYLLGTWVLKLQMQLTFGRALQLGVLPFLPGDALKIVLVLILGPILYRSLRQAGVFQNQ